MLFKSKQPHILGRRSKPIRQLTGPTCKLCSDAAGKDVSVRKEELVDCKPGDGKSYARVLVHCHNQEDFMEFDMNSTRWTYADLAKKMASHIWFDMKRISELAR